MKINIFAFATFGLFLTSGLTAHASRDAGELAANYFKETFAKPLQTAVPVDWSQPPLGCVEEMIPHPPTDRPCLDLTTVANPGSDWPAGIAQADHDYWYGQRRELTYCRSLEILRREGITPGSQSTGSVETAWMTSIAVNDYAAKVSAVYEAADKYGVPAQILTGAIYQESLFSELGISADGGNYSCGAEQTNLTGWCTWANTQSDADKTTMGWPLPAVDCNDSTLVNLSFVKPFYTIALTRLNGLPEYKLDKTQFQNIALTDVVSQWPAATDDVNNLRYQLIESFINYCQDPRFGILAIGSELQSLYTTYLSDAIKNKDRYLDNTRFARQCQQTSTDNAYPLHTGWLMAVGAYNAGPRSIDAVTYYNQWSSSDFNNPSMVQSFTPDLIVESIYWSGKFDAPSGKMIFANVEGAARNWVWYAGCVNQRHVARVMQNVTLLPEFFVDSLEGAFPCEPATTDANGNIVTSAPPARQTSSGIKVPVSFFATQLVKKRD